MSDLIKEWHIFKDLYLDAVRAGDMERARVIMAHLDYVGEKLDAMQGESHYA